MPDFTLESGRPADADRRLPKEIKCYDALDALGIAYMRVDHPAAFTMETCAEIDRVLGAMICKNLFLTNKQHTSFYLLLMPANKPFKTRELSAQIGSSRLSFASPEEMEEMLDCTAGSSSVMGLMNDSAHRVRLLVDRDVLSAELFGCHPCINTSSLRMLTSDVFGKFVPYTEHEMTPVTLLGE